jgi:hypothetical protein
MKYACRESSTVPWLVIDGIGVPGKLCWSVQPVVVCKLPKGLRTSGDSAVAPSTASCSGTCCSVFAAAEAAAFSVLNLLGRPRFAWWTVCYDKQLDSVITTSTQWSTYKNSLTHTLPIISLGTIITVKEKIPAVTPEPIPWFDLVDRDSWALPELAAARVEKGSQSWLCS